MELYCIENKLAEKELTVNKTYNILYSFDDVHEIVNDLGEKETYGKARFSEFPNADYNNDRLIRLVAACKPLQCFEYEGRIYKMYYVDAVKKFIKNNPTDGDMSVWFQDNLIELK